jgi:hypothetical protein
MSFNMIELYRLQQKGGAVLAKYQRLLAEADASMHDSPAHRAYGAFCKQWEADPVGTTQQAEQEARENPQ